jgi:hypothetical protein
MMKPNFYKILSKYLKLLILFPDGITITEQELNEKIEYHFQNKFYEFLKDHLNEVGYRVKHDNRTYIITRDEEIIDDQWE